MVSKDWIKFPFLKCVLRMGGLFVLFFFAGIKQTYYTADFNTKNQVVITSLGPSYPQSVVYEWSYANSNFLFHYFFLTYIPFMNYFPQIK